MAKAYKFYLHLNGNSVRTLDELRVNFSIDDILEAYHNGDLERWLSARKFQKELGQLRAIRATDVYSILEELSRIFNVSVDLNQIKKNVRLEASVFEEPHDERPQDQGKEEEAQGVDLTSPSLEASQGVGTPSEVEAITVEASEPKPQHSARPYYKDENEYKNKWYYKLGSWLLRSTGRLLLTMGKRAYTKVLVLIGSLAEWHREAAKLKHPNACMRLARMYEYGHNEANKIDYQQAIKWYHKAAKYGNVEAMSKLGDIYWHGNCGVNEDHREAAKWYIKAAERGDRDAQLRLSSMYLLGDGVEQNFHRSWAWMHRPEDLLASNSYLCERTLEKTFDALSPFLAIVSLQRFAHYKLLYPIHRFLLILFGVCLYYIPIVLPICFYYYCRGKILLGWGKLREKQD